MHLAGMMTDLPEHISTDKEVSDIAVAVHELLKQSCSQGRKPSMVTIARYAEPRRLQAGLNLHPKPSVVLQYK